MSLFGILSSPSQRRSFLLLSALLLGCGLTGILVIASLAPNTPIWIAANSFLTSIVAGGAFALTSGLYLLYFFVDPNDIAASSVLLPKDIGQTLENIAKRAPNYKVFVRTGRHFRAEILPILVKQARKNRRRIGVQVVLLDFRDEVICEKYAVYRNASSFDAKCWSTRYVQSEVFATILKLIDAARENPGLLGVHLFLTRRLSTFRIEGSSDEMLVTREDPKDIAARYIRTHHDFPAFVNEFDWIRDEAQEISLKNEDGVLRTVQEIFGEDTLITSLKEKARQAKQSGSPYAR